MKVKETIVVEGRDDTAAVKRAVEAETIETHGFGIARETWELLATAYEKTGLIVFTDPDHAGEEIRRRIKERFPDSKEAFLDQQSATSKGDVGIENAAPEAIRAALEKVVTEVTEEGEPTFAMEDLRQAGLIGTGQAAEKRQALGKTLGIGYGNGKSFLRKLNAYGIRREAFEEALANLTDKETTD